jgi:hypothetical protein
MENDDLRAAVAAGIIDEAQAARLKVLSDDRAGTRAAMPAEDEPFEFFRGFSEIFISIGLLILLSGVAGLLSWLGGFAVMLLVPAICAGVCWWWATYFTLKRRMTLPSMVLVSAYGSGIFVSAVALAEKLGLEQRSLVLTGFVITAAALMLWYRRFKLPFTALLIGLASLGLIYAATVPADQLAMLATAVRSGRKPGLCQRDAGFRHRRLSGRHVVRHARSAPARPQLGNRLLVSSDGGARTGEYSCRDLDELGGRNRPAGPGAAGDHRSCACDRPAVFPDGGNCLYRFGHLVDCGG